MHLIIYGLVNQRLKLFMDLAMTIGKLLKKKLCNDLFFGIDPVGRAKHAAPGKCAGRNRAASDGSFRGYSKS